MEPAELYMYTRTGAGAGADEACPARIQFVSLRLVSESCTFEEWQNSNCACVAHRSVIQKKGPRVRLCLRSFSVSFGSVSRQRGHVRECGPQTLHGRIRGILVYILYAYAYAVENQVSGKCTRADRAYAHASGDMR